ncbi:hypothetical protein LIER_10407 [Lithospermum erythrorhizon]|uniref:Uncharacterized protein n=1 Tax=Lithospermum erythrorhizon TaxID=34254 RepID=A0AAV3PKL9_LITER
MMASIISSGMGSGKSSFGQPWFRSLKSTHTLICPFFFRTGTIFDNQVGCTTSLMNLASMSLLISTSIEGTNSGQNRRCPCLTGCKSILTAKRCRATLGFNPGISEYVQAKKSLNYVSRDTYSVSSSEVKSALTYVGRGSSVVPRLISFISSSVALTCSSIPRGASIPSSSWVSPSSTVM